MFRLIPYPTPNPIDHPAFLTCFWFKRSLTRFIFSIFVKLTPLYGVVILSKLLPSSSMIAVCKLIPWLKSNLELNIEYVVSIFLIFNSPLKALQLYLSHSFLSSNLTVIPELSWAIPTEALIIESLIFKLVEIMVKLHRILS